MDRSISKKVWGILAMVVAAFLLACPQLAQTQVNLTEMVEMSSTDPLAEGSISCLLQDESCRILGRYRAVQFENRYGELVARLMRMNESEDLLAIRPFLRDQDLDSQLALTPKDEALTNGVSGDQRSLEFAPLTTADSQESAWQRQLRQIERLVGARYEVPLTSQDLKVSLGFSAETEIGTADWLEVLKVHMERTLGVDPEISEILIDLMSIESPSSAVNSDPVDSYPVIVETN